MESTSSQSFSTRIPHVAGEWRDVADPPPRKVRTVLVPHGGSNAGWANEPCLSHGSQFVEEALLCARDHILSGHTLDIDALAEVHERP